jgi:hypothetical protein
MALRKPLSTRLSRRLCLGATVLLAVLGLVAVPPAYDAFYQSRLSASPHRLWIETLRTEAVPGALVVIGGDEPSGAQRVYDDTYAFLQNRYDVTSVQTDWWFPDWQPRLEDAIETMASGQQVWIYAPLESPLHPWLAERYAPLAIYEFDGWRLTGWDTQGDGGG